MQRDLCECGRRRRDAATFHQRSVGDNVLTHHRCECGNEWSERRHDVDLAEPVTGEELITVHQRLKLNLPLSELLGT